MRLFEVYNIPRKRMPQINNSHLEAYPKKLQVVDINKVIPSQSDRVPGLVDKTLKSFKAGEKELMDKPMVVDRDLNIVNGHHRYDALKKMGMTKVPVLKVDATLPELIDDFSHTTSNLPVTEVKYTEPQLDVEWDEAMRYPEFRNIGKEAWIKLASKGKAVTVNDASDINNTDAADPNIFKSLNPAKQKRALTQLEKGTIEMPIVAVYSDGYKELVGGNTRLTAMMAKYGKGTVWQFEVPDEVAELAEERTLEAPKDWGDMNLDAKGKQDSIDYFYRTHAPSMGKPVKAGKLGPYNIVTFAKGPTTLMFLVDANDSAIFYVAFDKYQDGVAIGNVRSNGAVKATEVYAYLVKKYGKLYSDKHQTPDGRKIWANLAKYTNLKVTDVGDRLMATENFAEGNKAQKGIPANATDAQLRSARKAGGAKGKRAHWLLNMRKGNRKKK